MAMPAYSVLLILLLSIPSPYLMAQSLIWVEGEDAISNNMKPHVWYNSIKEKDLSAGTWLSHYGSGAAPVAKYIVDVNKADEYEFWLRANPLGAISYRLNGSNWQSVSFTDDEQRVNIASDGMVDLRFVSWVKSNNLNLLAGMNTLEFRFDSKNNQHGGLDSFVLSREPFLPNGNRKPGQKTGFADPGTWAFEPERDNFSIDALLDLSFLNDKPAGRYGRVIRSDDGASFLDGAGIPIRFWAVNTTLQYGNTFERLEEHARWLAKRGVNMVRHHGNLTPEKGRSLSAVNQPDIDAAWRLVAAMKKHGIYVTLSPYWASNVKNDPAWGLNDSEDDSLTGLIFFDKKLQNAYKNWLRELMTRPNPYTGIPLSKVPSVAIFQIQNEDSLLFWTETQIRGEKRIELGRHFAVWLKQKYGSLERASAAWGWWTGVRGDDFDQGIVMPQPIYEFTQRQRKAKANRISDQLQFYTELMHSFNLEMSRFLKDEIGYSGLINSGNWRTADQEKLLDAERYSYTANDIIGVNRYYGTRDHENPNEKSKAGYLISQGDIVGGQSVLKRPQLFPLALRQIQGYPMIISESAWVAPLRYQSEGPFLVAAYSALTGIDAFYWFTTSDVGYGSPMAKWQLSTPAQMGMFPAAALMFRQGYIQKGKPVLIEYRELDNLWARKPPLLAEEAGFDPNRETKTQQFSEAATQSDKLSPLVYLTGPVEMAFESGTNEISDLTSLIDLESKTVRSTTDELFWDYENGISVLNSPRAQGATGDFQAAGIINTDALTVVSTNSYASLLAVSMDGMVLTASNKILLQIGTTARPHGWRTEDIGNGKHRITDLGSSPWNIENNAMTITIKNTSLSSAIQLDANGVPVSKTSIPKKISGVEIEVPKDAMYIILQ